MIDIHSHILPGVDDGAYEMEESVDMVTMAAESGVKYIVATPHCNIPGLYDNYVDDEFLEHFYDLKRVVKAMDIPIQVLGGMEVFATPELPRLLQDKRVLTLNGTRYFLVEFAFDEEPDFCDEILEKTVRLGYIPVIAHPERYYFVQDRPQLVEKWYRRGYGIQVNKGSILGRFGRSVMYTVDQLLQHKVVTCVGSDAHSSYKRTPHMAEAAAYLTETYGEEYTNLLMTENPYRILTGKSLMHQGIEKPSERYDARDYRRDLV